jgi:crotonobetaine/carnitine-CoA ligase
MSPAEPFRPPWFNPAMPRREDCVLKAMLDERAALHPGRRIALFADGSEWSYGAYRARIRSTAAALQALGVRAGDRVVAWLPNGESMVRAWFATNYLGAVFVPLNTAYRGQVLAHTVNSSRARLMLAHGELVGRLEGLALPALERIVAFGPTDAAQGWPVVPATVLDGDEATLDDSAVIEPWDIQSIIFTSGTTGPSKGVLSPYLQLYTTGVVNYGYLRDGETVLINLPMFHVGGTSPLYAALVRAGCFYIVDGFDTARFWQQVRSSGCATTSGLIGVMGPFLARAEPRPDDRDNPLRCITMIPLNEQTIPLGERFGFDHVTGFNMTEVSTPLISDLNARVPGTCGRPRSGSTCRVVDANDLEVPLGTPGELIVRTDLPWTLNAGYDGMPEATATAWRNGWFHTGDVFRQDEAGNFYFVDRLKDTIRRRGENISSMEVEAAVRGHPAVEEVVAVGVPGDGAEEEVLVAVVAKAGQSLDPRELTEYLVPRLAYFMVPRYIRVVAAVPKTDTNKQRKVEFRDAGITADTWDREAAGIRLKRERLGSVD